MVHFLGFHAHYTIEFEKDLMQAFCKKERGERGNHINL